MTRVLFFHRSVGRHLIADGGLRELLRNREATSGVHLWDVDYAMPGAYGPHGEPTDLGFPIPSADTDPEGLLRLVSDPELADVRAAILNFDLVVLKSCYPASQFRSDDDLRARIALYREMINGCEQLPAAFLLLTPPPLTRLRTSRASAHRAVEVAKWMSEAARPRNVHVLDLHEVLRAPSGRGLGTLAPKYRLRAPWDSHPNLDGRRAGALALASALERIVPTLAGTPKEKR